MHLPVERIPFCSLPKPANIACPHLGPAGCRHYDIRGPVCEKFRCVWLADTSWPEVWRPDRIGLLCLRENLDGVGPAALVYETQPGALESREATLLLDELRHTTVFFTTVDYNKQSRLCTWGDCTPQTEPTAKPAAA